LREAVRLLPNSFRARRSLAEALEAEGNLAEAVTVRQEILELSAGDHEDLHALARTLGMAGRYEESWMLFERALAEQDKRGGAYDPWFYFNAGQTALAVQRDTLGLELLRRAEAHEATRLPALEAAAIYHLQRGNRNEAERILSEMILYDPHNPQPLRMRATSRYAAGDSAGAVHDLEHILRLDPSDQGAASRLREIRREGDESAAP
jgi:tetratricopeptide (TPR) repeat protein